ncbi:MAG: hypothetical protein H6Q57_1682, partial [Geobacteraceae bacterium]|nr:hypothetical protein [Geobacteraceae bacterium]
LHGTANLYMNVAEKLQIVYFYRYEKNYCIALFHGVRRIYGFS